MDDNTDEDFLRRALAAYYRSPEGVKQHSPKNTYVTYDSDNKGYVIIRDSSPRTLAVYRIRAGGALKLLKRHPRHLIAF